MSLEEKLYRENLELARVEKRILAFIVDKFIISFVFVVIYWDKFAQVGGDYYATIKIVETVFLQFLILNLVYETAFSMFYGATLGKILFKIKILSVDLLDHPQLFQALLRALLKMVGEILFYAPYLFAFLTPFKQALHDYFAKTIVVDNA